MTYSTRSPLRFSAPRRALAMALAFLLLVTSLSLSATPAVASHNPPPASTTPSCSSNEIVASNGTGELYRLDVTNATFTEVHSTSLSTFMNAVASNTDDGIVYWGFNSTVYYYDPLTDTDGTVINLGGSLNGTFSSGGAAYLGGFYYFGVEDSNGSRGLYSIQVDPAGDGTTFLAGTLTQLAADQPRQGLQAAYGGTINPDYGDLFVALDGSANPIIRGSTKDRNSSFVDYWSFTPATTAFSAISSYSSSTPLQLGQTTSGALYGVDTTNTLYSVNPATGARTTITTYSPPGGSTVADLGGTWCAISLVEDIHIDKTVANADNDSSGDVTVGDLLTYTFDVRNASNVALDNVSVSDPLSGLSALTCTPVAGSTLAPEATMSCSATYTVSLTDAISGSISNTATASGDGISSSPTDTDSLVTAVERRPAIQVTKTGQATAAVGDLVTYTYQLTHASGSDGTPVSGVTLGDDITGTPSFVSGDDGDGLLEAGETWTYTDAHTIAATDPDPLVNTVTASGTDLDGDPISDNDTHSLDIDFAPAIQVVKTGPATGAVGDTVTYTFSVSHAPGSDGSDIGTVALSDDIVGTPTYVSGDDGDNLLEAGETWTYTDTHTIAATDPDPLVNTATVSGLDRDGNSVGDTDSHSLDVEFNPTIQVVKTGPATADVGDTVTYTFSVSHGPGSDATPLSSVNLSDDITSTPAYVSGDDGDNVLEATETWVYQAGYTISGSEPDPLVNTATVSGTDLDGDTVGGTDSHSLDIEFDPTIEVVKSGPATAAVGDTVTYTFDLSHGTGSDATPISAVTVSDDVTGAPSYVSGDDGDNLLEVGETWTYTDSYTVGVGDPDPLVNTVTVSGLDRDGDPVGDADIHSLDINFAPIIQVVKTGPATAAVGAIVTYTFDVSHGTGSDGSDISAVTLSDDITGTPTYVSGDDGDNLLEIGETWTYTDTHTVTATDPDPLVNTATVAANDRDGGTVGDTDSHSLDIEFAPAIQIAKSGPAVAAVGDTITYTFDVSHGSGTDGSAISGVAVGDSIAGAAILGSGDDGDNLLELSETWQFTATYTVAATDPDPLVNVGTVTGTDRDGDPLSDNDTHSLDIDFAPIIEVVKTGPATAAVGAIVTYTFDVSHGTGSDGSDISAVTLSDDVTGTPTYVSGDDGDNLLEIGETWTYTDTHTVTATDSDPLVNTATVNGLDRDGGTVSDNDTHSLDIEFAPAVQVVKNGPATANVGDVITYTFEVSHAAGSDGSDIGAVTLSDDIVGTPTFGSGGDGDSLLEAGETWTYTAAHTVTATDPDPLINTATVSGTDRDGDPLSDADSHSLDIEFAPAIQVIKTGPASAAVGDVVTYGFAVSHGTGSDGSAIAGLSLTDDITGSPVLVAGDDGDNLLEIGETWTYTDTHTVTATDPDPLVNTATVNGTDRDGDPASDTDTHSLDIEFAPAIQVVKSGPATASPSQNVVYTFEVSHGAGSDGSDLSGVVLTESLTVPPVYISGDDGDNLLEASETWTYQATRTVLFNDPDPLINIATVTANDRDGDAITDFDSHSLDVDYMPTLEIVKSGPASATVGTTVTYTFEVSHAAGSDGTNILNVALTDSVTGSPIYVSGDDGDGLLESAETWTYTASLTVAASDPDPLINTATVTAEDEDGEPLNAQDSHSLDITFAPVIEVVKTGPVSAAVGDTITYTFDVTHAATSDGTDITGVTLSDDVTGAPAYVSGDDGDNVLESGETWTYADTYTVTGTDPDPLINTATVSGTDLDGDVLADADGHLLDIVFDPTIQIVKSGPATAAVGDTITYTFVVTHGAGSDDTSISAVTVSDDIAGTPTYGSGDDGDNLLESGEAWTYAINYTVLGTDPDPLINTATASGVDRDGDPVSDTDSHSLDIGFSPAIEIVKSGPATAAVGDTVTYTFSVSHGVGSDGSDVSSITLSDDVTGTPTYASGDDGDGILEVTETWTYTDTHTVTATDPDPLVNTATVSGTDLDGGSITATDSHSLDVDFVPAIQVVKTGPATGAVGNTVTYTFEVSHAVGSDGSDISSVTVTDDIAGAAAFVAGDDGDNLLEAGETWTYDVSYTITASDPDLLINTATATGTDRDGGTVTDTDSHSLDIDFAPAILVVKNGPASANVGDTITYTFSVSHSPGSDGSDISSVILTDDITGTPAYVSGDDGDSLLEAGETWTYTDTHTIAATDPDPLVNTATAIGTDRDGGTVSDTDSHSLDVTVSAALDIAKSGPATAAVGDTVTYTFDISHTPASDGSDISSVTVTDDIAGAASYMAGDDGDNLLEAGETWTFSVSYTIQPTDPTPLVNTATAAGTNIQGGAITATDTHSTSLTYAPIIDVVKSGPASQAIGNPVTYTFDVSHAAGSDGTPVTITSIADSVTAPPTYLSGDDGDNLLESGETWTYQSTHVVSGSDPNPLINVVDVTATDPAGGTVSASDDHSLVVVDASLTIVKNPANQTVVNGNDAGFTITVTNTGNADLANVTVSDPLTPSCDTTIGTLTSGSATTINCTAAGVTSDFTNIASVTGDDPFSNPVTASDTAYVDVINPAIAIAKTPNTQFVQSGGDADFTLTVTNTGDVDLVNVTVTDPAVPACDSLIGGLVVGANYTINCTANVVTSDFTNTASVSAQDPTGSTTTDSDDAFVDVISPAIAINKDPASQFLVSGNDAPFTITVSNPGDVDLTNVVLSDPAVPACDTTIGTLAAGASTTINCTATGVTSDFTNTATATADHPAGGTVTDTDTADVDVIAPAISIAKNPANQAVVSGGTATFSIEVTNPGDVDLTNVVLSDPAVPACDTTIGTLAPGTSTTINCTATGVTSDFTNTATATADHPAGGTVTDTDSADVTVLVPAIEIQKTPDLQTVLFGGIATFTITVTNTGALDLNGVSVSDPAVPACDTAIGPLVAGGSTSYTCSASGLTLDFTNTADVTGTDPIGGTVTDSDTADIDVIAPAISVSKTPDVQSVVSGGTATFSIEVANTGDVDLVNVSLIDPAVPACDAAIGALAAGTSTTVTCPAVGVTGDFTNTANVVGEDQLGNSVSDSDTADVTVLIPAIDIQKSPDLQTVGYGSTVTFAVTVTNVGDTALTGTSVSDPLAPLCDAAVGDLAIGASTSYTCSLANVTADFTNTADVAATDPLGGMVADSDTADIDVITPVIDIAKTPNFQTVASGADATFTLTVTNNGDVTLDNVAVSDPLVPSCDTNLGSMAPGATQTITCTAVAVTAGFTNTADVSATDPLGQPLSDTDTAVVDVITPGLEIRKTPDLQQILTGGTATFTITVTNTGTVDLTGVTVNDPAVPACDAPAADLAQGDSISYACSAAGLTGDLTNIATASGTDPLGGTVTDSDSADVDVIAPALTIAKTPDSQSVVLGSDATFTVSVSNPGDVDLTGVVISDAAAPGCATSIGTLVAGSSTNVTCTVNGVTADFTNSATVTGTDPIGNTLSATDNGDVTVLVPAVDIQKTPDVQTVASGGDATFTITVTNAGGTALDNVTVNDPAVPACDAAIGTLAVGAVASYSCTLGGASADFTNVADVNATDPIGGSVSDSDTADVDVIAPAISVSKTPDSQSIYGGDTANFSIEVTNTGDVDLVNVAVSDPAVPDCNALVGNLAIGTSATITCSGTASADFTNTASVSGEDSLGSIVTDSDTADVTVLIPAVEVQKTPDVQAVVEGQTATFTITVTNTGATPLIGVAVTDPLVPACDLTIGSLAIGAVSTHTCTITATASFTNSASVAATDPAGNSAADTDTADLVVIPIGDANGHVFVDSNGDGVQTGGEVDLANVDVAITLPDGSTVVVATDSGGNWSITGVEAGTIAVDVDESDPDFPPGHVLSTANDPQNLTVVGGTSVFASPVGYAPTGSISGIAWEDLNGDGIQTGEPPLGNVDVALWEDTDGDGAGDTYIGNVTTAADGSYNFAGLAPGDYEVRFGTPAGYFYTASNVGGDDSIDSDVDATGRTTVLNLATGATITDVDAGMYQPIAIGDFVWADADNDGVFDAGELGAAGSIVTAIWAGPDGVFGTGDDSTSTTTSAADGSYGFAGLAPGNYRVAVEVPSGANLTFGDDPYLLTATSGNIFTDIDFALSGTASIDGTLWIDLNANGLVESGEPRLAGATVAVANVGPDGVPDTADDVVTTVVTGAGGGYTVDELVGGTYQVSVDRSSIPDGLLDTYDVDGTADSMTTMVLPTGASATDVDFGYRGSATLSGRVWLDLDADGTIDSSEPNLEGVAVTITWAGPDGLVGTSDDATFSASTDAAGNYSLTDIPAGTYRVTVDTSTLPAGLAATYDRDGGLDSTTSIDVPAAATEGNIDFGYTGTGSIGDEVFVDANDDGLPNPGELRLPGVDVVVRWAGLDGVLGTADDVVFNAVTGADGSYLLTGLPGGVYQVSVVESSLGGDYTSSGPVILTLSAGVTNLDGDIAVTSVIQVGPPTASSQPLPQTGIDGDRMAMLAMLLIMFGLALLVLSTSTTGWSRSSWLGASALLSGFARPGLRYGHAMADRESDQVELRTNDLERDAAIARIQHAMVDGYVEFDELDERYRAVYQATNRAELSRVTADLPEAATPGPGGRQPVSATALRVIGDYQRGGWIEVGDRMTVISLIGDTLLDLSTAAMPADGTTIEVWSLIGDVRVIVPDGVRVLIQAVTVIGDHLEDLVAPIGAGPLVEVKVRSLIGGAWVMSLSRLSDRALRKIWRSLRR